MFTSTHSCACNFEFIPTEILAIIFQECVTLAHAQDGLMWCYHSCTRRCLLDWVCITHVCRRWRTIALSQPLLWSHLILLYPSWAKTMLARAKTAPLTISLGGEQGQSQLYAERLADMLHPEWRQEMLVLASTLDQVYLTEDQMQAFAQIENLQTKQNFNDPAIREEINRRTLELSETFRVDNLKKKEEMKAALKVHSKCVSKYGPLIQSFSSLTDGGTNVIDCLTFSSCRLTRLHLASAYSLEHLGKMDTLEELVLNQCLEWTTDRNMLGVPLGTSKKIHLPALQSLHIKDALYCATDFAAELKTTKPLRCLAIEDYDDDSRDMNVLSLFHPPEIAMSVREFVTLSTESPRTGAESSSTFPDHYCVLRAKSQWCPGSRSKLQLIAWRRETTEPSDIVTWEREGKIPHLPSVRPSTHSHASESVFYKTDPALHFYFPIVADPPVDSCTLNALRTAFSLHSVVFATIKVCGHWRLMDGPFELTRESARAFFAETASLRVLEVYKYSAARLVEVLTPYDGQCALASELEEIWFEEVDFAEETLTDALVLCVTARTASGCSLKKLVLRNCINIDLQELTTFTGLDVEAKTAQSEAAPQVWEIAGSSNQASTGLRGRGRGGRGRGRSTSKKTPARGRKKQQK
ncbi:hypothetical protein CONPUDRAFT_73995 [Coniophora puteana RWD-64-598 SS2]|uniref:Uncharacterized protein n=1 Tax=Coniophora puteana (strain RWD-64-598) TaxID=741705 RepID=A0A5M3MK41_CONPW|nr:uncharacterized protein CONPUDRAFT_73995 [Coniophora puteana RWD-64-598 SS2]EIW79598.1 hypothetical protein CONPUDRAFT_73995 [Coniophora puteana RWD-64-598 SS2]